MANLRVDNLTGTGGRNAIDGSVFFDGADSYLVCTDNSDFALGTGDFTVEGWFLVDTNLDYRSFIDNRTSVSDDWMIGMRSNDRIYVYAGGFLLESPTGSVTPGHWHHVAYVRSSGTHALYLNGVSVATSSTSKDYDSQKLAISAPPYNVGAEEFKGYVSNVRIIKGTAVYTANFTPPTEKLTVIDGTVLLCCQDSDDPTQEATGKTITGYGNLDITQTEKINGRFNQDPAGNGWTVHSGASASYANGQWTVTSPAQIWSGASTSFTSVIGQQYRLTALVVTSNNWGSISVANGGQSAAKIVYAGWSGGGTFPLTVNKIFTATATTTHVSIDNLNTTNTTATTVQYVSVKPVEVGKAPKVLPSVGVDEGVTFKGDTKVNSQSYMYFPTGDTSQRGRGRAVIWMGIGDTSANYTKNIDYIEIQTLGNTIRFGDISDTVGLGAAMSSSTRGVMAGGSKPGGGGGNQNFLEYVTIATTGNAKDFGGVSTTFRYGAGISNQTRGLIAGAYQGGGAGGTLNTIQYLTIATRGDTLDFGDMVADGGTGVQGMGACSSSTRGITFGAGTPTTINEMNYITIMSTGNSVDFGDLSATRYLCQGVSNGTRGVVAGGDNSGAVNIIEYITIATTGNATDFGDLSSISEFAGGTGGSNKIRGVFVGRGDWTTTSNSISYITIATTGNAEDFGDVRTGFSNYGSNALSDSHGGLS